MGIVTIENTTVGVSPDNILSVTKDVIIPYQAIMSSSEIEVYYGTETGTILSWPANVILPVHPEMRLVTTTTCWVYGERTSPS